MSEPRFVFDLLTSRILRLSNSFGLYGSRRYRDQFGVTLPEWRVMSVIANHGTTSAREISRALATDKAWVGLSVEKLRKRGLVNAVVDPSDKRRTLVSLTDAGTELHDAVLVVARQRQKRLMDALPPGAKDILTNCLDLLQAEADRMLQELDEQDRLAQR